MTDAGALEDVVVVDTELFGAPGLHSAYLLDTPSPVLVDAGAAPATDVVAATLSEHGVDATDLAGIVATHVHLDHAGAVGALAQRFPDATVYVHPAGEPYLTDADRLDRLSQSARAAMGDEVAAAYGTPETVPADRTRCVSDGDEIPCGDRVLNVIHTPGHAPHQVALQDARTDAVFVADAAGMYLGGELLPTTPAPDFDLDESLRSLARLRERGPSALCYGHFGTRRDAVDAIDAAATVLEEWVAAIEEALADPGVETRSDLDASLRGDWSSPTLERDIDGVLHALDKSL